MCISRASLFNEESISSRVWPAKDSSRVRRSAWNKSENYIDQVTRQSTRRRRALIISFRRYDWQEDGSRRGRDDDNRPRGCLHARSSEHVRARVQVSNICSVYGCINVHMYASTVSVRDVTLCRDYEAPRVYTHTHSGRIIITPTLSRKRGKWTVRRETRLSIISVISHARRVE